MRIYFPGLVADATLGSTVNDVLRRGWYEKVLRPAVLDMQQTRDPDFPSTYDQLLANSRRPNGQFLRPTRLFPALDLAHLEWRMRRNIEDCREMDWARGFFFGHQLRGIKPLTQHSDTHGDGDMDMDRSPAAALFALMDSVFHREAVEPSLGNFYIDIGMELYEPRHSLHWRRASHAPILTHLMPTLNADTISSMVTPGADGYFEDVTALLRPISGFRYAPKLNVATPTGVYYIQCYSTDKGVSHSGILNNNTLSLNLADGFKGEKPARDKMGAISGRFSAAHMARVATSARTEIRVAFRDAATMLLPMSWEFYKSLIIRVRASTFW